MEMSTIILYGLAIIGPLMIFLTRYVVKGKTRAAVRLWFITFFMYVIFYWVAKGAIMVTGEEPFSFALLWPIGSILAFWAVEKLLKSDDAGVPYFKWMAFFLIAVLFALVVDALAGAFGCTPMRPVW